VQGDPANVLFAQEVADLNDLAVLDHVDVDGEMGVYVAHFVAEALAVRMLATRRGNGGLVWVGKGLGGWGVREVRGLLGCRVPL